MMAAQYAMLRWALQSNESKRVAILDLDAHNGDGIQDLMRHWACALGLNEHVVAPLQPYLDASASIPIAEKGKLKNPLQLEREMLSSDEKRGALLGVGSTTRSDNLPHLFYRTGAVDPRVFPIKKLRGIAANENAGSAHKTLWRRILPQSLERLRRGVRGGKNPSLVLEEDQVAARSWVKREEFVPLRTTTTTTTTVDRLDSKTKTFLEPFLRHRKAMEEATPLDRACPPVQFFAASLHGFSPPYENMDGLDTSSRFASDALRHDGLYNGGTQMRVYTNEKLVSQKGAGAESEIAASVAPPPSILPVGLASPPPNQNFLVELSLPVAFSHPPGWDKARDDLLQKKKYARSAWHASLQEAIRALKTFRPDLILLGTGYDGLHSDQLTGGQLGLQPSDFSSALDEVAKACPNARFISILEGGYGAASVAPSQEGPAVGVEGDDGHQSDSTRDDNLDGFVRGTRNQTCCKICSDYKSYCGMWHGKMRDKDHWESFDVRYPNKSKFETILCLTCFSENKGKGISSEISATARNVESSPSTSYEDMANAAAQLAKSLMSLNIQVAEQKISADSSQEMESLLRGVAAQAEQELESLGDTLTAFDWHTDPADDEQQLGARNGTCKREKHGKECTHPYSGLCIKEYCNLHCGRSCACSNYKNLVELDEESKHNTCVYCAREDGRDSFVCDSEGCPNIFHRDCWIFSWKDKNPLSSPPEKDDSQQVCWSCGYCSKDLPPDAKLYKWKALGEEKQRIYLDHWGKHPCSYGKVTSPSSSSSSTKAKPSLREEPTSSSGGGGGGEMPSSGRQMSFNAQKRPRTLKLRLPTPAVQTTASSSPSLLVSEEQANNQSTHQQTEKLQSSTLDVQQILSKLTERQQFFEQLSVNVTLGQRKAEDAKVKAVQAKKVAEQAKKEAEDAKEKAEQACRNANEAMQEAVKAEQVAEDAMEHVEYLKREALNNLNPAPTSPLPHTAHRPQGGGGAIHTVKRVGGGGMKRKFEDGEEE